MSRASDKRINAIARFRAEAGRFRPKTGQDGSILASPRKRVVRAGGLEPPRPVRVCGFSYHFGFRRLVSRVRGLDYPFTIPPDGGLGAARLVSTPSQKDSWAWLGIAIQGFPDFEQFYSAGFPDGHSIT